MPRSLFVRTLPKPSRQDILDLYQQGLTTREVANRLQISEPWARRVKQQHREEGISRNAVTRRRSASWEPLRPRIEQAIADQPDLTLAELKQRLGTHLHPGTLCRALKKIKLTFKKSDAGLRARPPGHRRQTPGLETHATPDRSPAVGVPR